MFVADEGVETTGRSDNDVRVSVLVLQDLGVLLDGGATIEDASLDVGHVLGEPVVLVANLEGELTGVAHDQDRALAGDGLDLLEGGEDKYSCLTKTRLGLADDVTTKKGLRDTCLLNCKIGSMLEYDLARYEQRETER